MTPEETQRTMDFILQSQAASVVRMDRVEEAHEELQEQLDILTAATRDLAKVSREELKRIRALEKSDRELRESDRALRERIERLDGSEQ